MKRIETLTVNPAPEASMRHLFCRTIASLALAGTAACAPGPPPAPRPASAPPPPPAWEVLLGDLQPDAEVYLAELRPLNAVPAGQAAAGRAAVVVWGDSVRIAVATAGLATGEVHRPEFHGIEGRAHATCPATGAGAHGMVGPVEAEPFSGGLLFAFSPVPTPEMPDTGAWVSHEQTVALAELETGLRKVHDGILRLDPERRVVYIQRLPRADAPPGEAVAAHPFPVACGEFRRATG